MSNDNARKSLAVTRFELPTLTAQPSACPAAAAAVAAVAAAVAAGGEESPRRLFHHQITPLIFNSSLRMSFRLKLTTDGAMPCGADEY